MIEGRVGKKKVSGGVVGEGWWCGCVCFGGGR